MQDDPRRIMMWQNVACSIDLEGWPRHLARQVWTDGEGCEQLAKWLDNHEHDHHSRAAERLQLVFRLLAMNKIAHEHLQQDFVAGVEQFGDAGRLLTFNSMRVIMCVFPL